MKIVHPAYLGAELPPPNCVGPKEHRAEAWALTECLKSGDPQRINFAGLHAEMVGSQLVGVWKVMRCGCMFVAVVGAR